MNGDGYEVGLADPPSPFVTVHRPEPEFDTQAFGEPQFDHEGFDHEDLRVDEGEEAWLDPPGSIEAELEWLGEDEAGAAELGWLGEQLELEDEDPNVVGRIRDAVAAGMWSVALRFSIAAGQRDENALTNLVFRTRHPELGGRPIQRDEGTLAAEWVNIRDLLVRPALRGQTGDGAATRTAMQRLSTETLRQAWASSRCNDADMVPLEFLGRRTPVNRLARDAYAALARALESTGYNARSAWCYTCRKIRNSENWSLHSYGLAIDIDPACNPHRVGRAGPARLSAGATQSERCADVRANRADTNLTREQIAAAEAIRTVDGLRVFSWAGHWRRSPDAMHFQIDVTPAELRRGLAQGADAPGSPVPNAVRIVPPRPTVQQRELESGGSFADEVFQRGHEAGPAVAIDSEVPAPVWLAEAMAGAYEADEQREQGVTATAAGSFEVEHLPLLASHRGTRPDLVLRWNAMTSPSAIDVVVHFHGYSGDRQRMHLPTSKAPRSGLDLVDPPSGGPGRGRPTLAVLPRGNYFGGRSGIGYNFPALTAPGALRALIREAMELFANRTGVRAPVGRTILTGHSGGGAPIMAILRHEDPDEVHTFDALYGNPAALIAWARKRIERDLAQGSPGGALRVIYRGGEPTDANSQRVRRALCPVLARAGNSAVSARYRVERTRVGHNDVPSRFGGALLADAGADVPGLVRHVCSLAPRREAESWEQGELGAEWAEKESAEMSMRRDDGAEWEHEEQWESELAPTELGRWNEGGWGEAASSEAWSEQRAGEDEAWEASASAVAHEWDEDGYVHEWKEEDAHESLEHPHVHEWEDGEAEDTELVAATAAYEALSSAIEVSDLDRARRRWEAEDEGAADEEFAVDASTPEYEVLSAAFEAADVVRASPGFEDAHHEHGLAETQEYEAFEAADIGDEDTRYTLEEAVDEEAVESSEVELGEAEAFLDDLYSREVVVEDETGATVTFPSGATLRAVSGPTGKDQEQYDPWATGNPLLDTGASVRATLLSRNFTVGELTRSGGDYFDKARIDPNLVRCLQELRDHVGKPVQITSSYRPYGYNDKLYKEKYKKNPTQSRHSSGQAVDIRIAGMTGMEIAKTAIDVCGTTLGIGIANTFAHIDVRPTWGKWTYFGKGTEKDSRAIAEIEAYRNQRLGGGAARPPAAPPAQHVEPPPGVATQMLDALGRGLWDRAIRIAISAGITDTNRLTNMLFYLRHPELRGKRIAPEQRDLAREWIEIRDRTVKPALLVQGVNELQRSSEEAPLETLEDEEYLDLPWQRELEEPPDGKLGAFEAEDFDEGMARVERLKPYSQIRGIPYTPAERKFAAQHPGGFVRTFSVVGKNESHLQTVRPAPIEVSRELNEFDGGKLGVFVHTYNGFVLLMDEALHGLGRVQDLYKAGAPLKPDNMTPIQKRRMRPTSDLKASMDIKTALGIWLVHKENYERAVGVAATTPRQLADAKRTYWAKLDFVREKILERRKVTKDAKELKKLEIVEIGLKDLIPIAASIAASATPLGVGLAVGSLVAEKVIDAEEGRKKYDDKVADMQSAIKSLKLGWGAVLEELAVALRAMYDGRPALERPQQLRVVKRKAAAEYGQSLGTVTEWRGRVAAELRMPAMMADAQGEIATAAPLARIELRKAMAFKPTVELALNKYQLELRGAEDDRRRSPESKRFYYHDITKIRYAYGELQKWHGDLLEVINTQSRDVNKPWREFLARLYQ